MKYNTPLKRYKYLPLKLADIPEDVKMQPMRDGYIENRKGMYGLPQAGLLEQ